MGEPRRKPKQSANTTPNKSEFEAVCSREKRMGRRLTLNFIGTRESERPVLDRIEFKFKESSVVSYCQRGDLQWPLNWRKVADALSLCFLGYVSWSLRQSDGQFFFIGKRTASLAASLGDATWQPKHALCKLFAEGSIDQSPDGSSKTFSSVIGSVFGGFNRTGKNKKHERRITVNPEFLPTDCVEIYWDRTDSGRFDRLTGLSQILDLAGQIQEALGLKLKERIVLGEIPRAQGILFDYEKYADVLRTRYGYVPFEILDAGGGRYRRLSFPKLFVSPNVRECQEYLSRALEAPKEQFQRLQREHPWRSHVSETGTEALQRHFVQQVPWIAIDLVNDNDKHRIVILGELGSGKSSLLQFLALRWAEAKPSAKYHCCLPVLIELKFYGTYASVRRDTHDLIEFLDRAAGAFWRFPKDQLLKLLAAGTVSMLFDGLDDILDPLLRKEVVEGIIRLAHEYPHVRMVVTSRLFGYSGEALRQAGFQHFLIQDFENDQIMRFIENWGREFRYVLGPRHTRKLEILKRRIRESRVVRELAGNPFLLTLMANVSLNGDIPVQRVDLLDCCLSMLLSHWKADEALRAHADLARDATVLGISEKKSILRRIAHEMAGVQIVIPRRGRSAKICRGPSAPVNQVANIIPRAKLEATIAKSVQDFACGNPLGAARIMIRHFRERNGILCLVGDDHYGFVHRAFFEFFCADDLRVQFSSGIVSDKDLKSFFEAHWYKEHWREPLCLFCGMVEPDVVGSILTHLLISSRNECACFAADCLKEVKKRNQIDALSVRIKHILSEISKLEPPELKDLARYLKVTPTVRDKEEKLRIQWPVTYSLWQQEALKATEALGVTFHDTDDLGIHLQRLADSSKFEVVQEAAVRIFAREWKDQPDTRGWLEIKAQEAKSMHVRVIAVEALTDYWPGPTTLQFLKNRLELDDEPLVRISIVHGIANSWKKDGSVLRWLKRQVTESKHPDVRTAAIEGVAHNHRGSNIILSWLKGLVRTHRDDEVRSTTVREIANNWNGVAVGFSWTEAIARSDRSEKVRVESGHALLEKWPNYSASLSLFKWLIGNDSCGDVRHLALWGLVNNWKNDAQIPAILKSSALSDTYYPVRILALISLAEDWQHEPETLPILEACIKDKDVYVARSARVIYDSMEKVKL